MSSLKSVQKKSNQREKKNIQNRGKQIKKGVKKTCQQTLPFKTIYKDGICELENGHWSKTITFFDVNYQIAKHEDKLRIFEGYSQLINSFDSSVYFELSLQNEFIDVSTLEKEITIAEQEDELNTYRREYNNMLSEKIKQGKNSVRRSKYISFSVKAKDLETARLQLNRVEIDVLSKLKEMGSNARVLQGWERVKLLHTIYNPCDTENFDFDYDYLIHTGLTVKDFIAPTVMDFSSDNYFQSGNSLGHVAYMQITAPELPDDFLTELADVDSSLMISLHLNSVRQDLAIKRIRKQLAVMESAKIEKQKQAVKQGYDMNLIPADLKNFIEEAENLLEELRGRNQKMFVATLIVMNTADDINIIERDFEQLQTIAQKHNCRLVTLTEQQEDGLNSVVPLGINKLGTSRTLTTASTAIFMPFSSQELSQPGGMYYGLNAQSYNLIMFNRKTLMNANGLIFGASGSGKSFTAKREMLNVLLNTDDDLIVIDPDGEYTALTDAFRGEVAYISAGSSSYINPFDMSLNYGDEEDPIKIKSEFILSLCENLLGGKNGLSAKQKSLIDRCVSQCYKKYLAKAIQENIPTMQDFYELLLQQPEAEAKDIALSLEIYVRGSLNVFAKPTNVKTDSRFLVYNTKNLGQEMKTMGLLIVFDQIWNRITQNRMDNRKTWIYIDEFHLLLKTATMADYFANLYKRIRKYYGIPTGITQDIEDVLKSEQGRGIFSNSEFIQMLNQKPAARAEIAEMLTISKQQLNYITNVPAGHGLLYAGGAIVPFADDFPEDTELYKIMSTKAN